MRVLIVFVTLSLLPGAIFGACGDCPPTVDWTVVEELLWILADDPAEDVGALIVDAFPAGAGIPIERPSLKQAMVESCPGVIEAIEEQQPWAIELGLRLAATLDFAFRPEVQVVLGELASDDPELVLRSLKATYDSSQCGGFLHGFVQYFGTPQEVRDGTEPLFADVERRLTAMKQVDQPELLEVRDMCVGLLEVQAQNIRESPFPRMLRRPNFDSALLKCSDVRSCFVVARATIGTDGQVASVEILRGGDPEIDQAVVDGLSRIGFEPKTENGTAVEFEYILSVRAHP